MMAQSWTDVIVQKYEMNWCGCGRPEDGVLFAYTVLRLLADRSDTDWSDAAKDAVSEMLPMDDPGAKSYASWFVLYALDSYGFLEHGSGVGGSWLTEKGREFINDVQKLYPGEEAQA